jgi:hypothetical protein
LHDLVRVGKIKAAMVTTSPEVLLRESDVRAQLPREEQPEYKRFSHLRGVEISISAGARKYGIPNQTICRWVQKGYIQTLGQLSNKKMIDEADLAYCAQFYKTNPGQGKWTFTKEGNPYVKK